jgi:hypothetical protein
VVVLTSSPPRVASSDHTPLAGTFLQTNNRVHACQAHEQLPRGASSVRLSLYDADGPRVTVAILSGRRVLTDGVRGAGWIGESPTVPLRPVSRSYSDVTVCFALGETGGIVGVDGSEASLSEGLRYTNGKELPGRMRVEYLAPGDSSWLSLATVAARHMGLGRWPTGSWLALFELVVLAALAGGVAWLIVRQLP